MCNTGVYPIHVLSYTCGTCVGYTCVIQVYILHMYDPTHVVHVYWYMCLIQMVYTCNTYKHHTYITGMQQTGKFIFV